MNQLSQFYGGRDLEAMQFAYNYHCWILSLLQPFIGADIVEVGAGNGQFTQLLLESCPLRSLIAVEPSVNLLSQLRARLNPYPQCTVVPGLFKDCAQTLTKSPQTIVYINVLEHIADDRAELEFVYDALAPGGYLGIFVPAGPWLYGSLDAQVGHYRRYRKAALESLVQSVGFTLIRSQYFDSIGIMPWWINFCLLKRQTIKAHHIAHYDKIVVPWMRRLEQWITPPIGKNILMVARKQ